MATQGTDCVECGESLSLSDDGEVGRLVVRFSSGSELKGIDPDPFTIEPALALEGAWGE